MTTTFLHMADVHLGYKQYQSDERFKDFSRAFTRAIDDAITRQVDFVLIAGDLFHKAAIDPATLLQAKRPLDKLRTANIPAIAITGNHDGFRYGQRVSWLDYLAGDNCLTVLKPSWSNKGEIELYPSNGRQGAYIDLPGARVIGLPYLGAATAGVLRELPALLPALPRRDAQYTILMGHFGLEGEVPNMNGTITHNLLAPLKNHIDYLALGHIHKPIERDNWIYNPGSLETCGMDERRWPGGWYHVAVDTGNRTHQISHIRSKRRPFRRLTIDVNGLETPVDLYDAVRSDAALLKRDNAEVLKPVIEVRLEGVLSFDRHDLDLNHIERLVLEALDPLKVLVRNKARATEYEVDADDNLDRAALERQVLAELIIRDNRYRARAEEWARLMSEIKSMALRGSDPQFIVNTLAEQLDTLDPERGG